MPFRKLPPAKENQIVSITEKDLEQLTLMPYIDIVMHHFFPMLYSISKEEAEKLDKALFLLQDLIGSLILAGYLKKSD